MNELDRSQAHDNTNNSNDVNKQKNNDSSGRNDNIVHLNSTTSVDDTIVIMEGASDPIDLNDITDISDRRHLREIDDKFCTFNTHMPLLNKFKPMIKTTLIILRYSWNDPYFTLSYNELTRKFMDTSVYINDIKMACSGVYFEITKSSKMFMKPNPLLKQQQPPPSFISSTELSQHSKKRRRMNSNQQQQHTLSQSPQTTNEPTKLVAPAFASGYLKHRERSKSRPPSSSPFQHQYQPPQQQQQYYEENFNRRVQHGNPNIHYAGDEREERGRSTTPCRGGRSQSDQY